MNGEKVGYIGVEEVTGEKAKGKRDGVYSLRRPRKEKRKKVQVVKETVEEEDEKVDNVFE